MAQPVVDPQGIEINITAEKQLVVQDYIFLSNFHLQAVHKAVGSGPPALVVGFRGSDSASTTDFALGKAHLTSYMACARIKIFWQTPEFGTSLSTLPPDTQFLLAEVAEGGPYVAAVPMIDSGTFRFTIRPPSEKDDNETLVLRMDSGSSSVSGSSWDNAVLLAAGWDPYRLVEHAVGTAAMLSGGSLPRCQKQLPDSINWFGWCTWDAFYHGVSAEGVQAGLNAFAAGGCPPRFLIIDDGWQSTSTPEGRAATYPRHEALITEDRLSNSSETSAVLHLDLDTLKGYQGPHPHWHLTAHTDQPAHPSDRTTTANTLLHALPPSQTAEHITTGPLPGQIEADVINSPPSSPPSTAPSAPQLSTTPPSAPKPPSTPWWAINAVNVAWHATPSFLRPLLTSALRLFPGQHIQECMDHANTALSQSKEFQDFAAAASGPLKQAMVEHYVKSCVHANRLAAPRCNDKFASVAGGPTSGDSYSSTDGFAGVVSDLKDKYGLRYVYVWHALFGYWAGVDLKPQFEAAKALQVQQVLPALSAPLLELEPPLAWNQQVLSGFGLPSSPEALYQEMHSYLQAAGVDGVKVDAQSMVSLAGTGLQGGSALAAQFQGALEDSISAHFPGNHCINCMCHSSENMYRMRDTAVARVSDDFWPLDPASHTTHVAVCAYNTLYMGALVQPDWDMFHSRHPRALLHATARIVSGGGVYVSDKPGRHDFELLRRLVAPDGGLLRPLLPGRPTRDCLFKDVMRDNRTLLKVWNHNPCSGLLAVFHLQGSSWSRPRRMFHTHDPSPAPLSTAIRPSDVEHIGPLAAELAAASPGVTATGEYAVYSDRTGRVTLLASAADSLEMTLSSADSDMLTVAPVLSCSGTKVAAVGLVNMLNSGGSVRSLQLRGSSGPAPVGQAVELEMQVYGTGVLVVWCSAAPKSCRVGGGDAVHRYDAARKELVVLVEASPEVPLSRVVVQL